MPTTRKKKFSWEGYKVRIEKLNIENPVGEEIGLWIPVPKKVQKDLDDKLVNIQIQVVK